MTPFDSKDLIPPLAPRPSSGLQPALTFVWTGFRLPSVGPLRHPQELPVPCALPGLRTGLGRSSAPPCGGPRWFPSNFPSYSQPPARRKYRASSYGHHRLSHLRPRLTAALLELVFRLRVECHCAVGGGMYLPVSFFTKVRFHGDPFFRRHARCCAALHHGFSFTALCMAPVWAKRRRTRAPPAETAAPVLRQSGPGCGRRHVLTRGHP